MKKRGLVYSTDQGRTCPTCNNPSAQCSCSNSDTLASTSTRITISRSTKGRNGKAVIVISGIPLPPDKLKMLATELKRKCGGGGTIKKGTIEIQGEHLDLLKDALSDRGYHVIRVGG